MKKYAIIVAGGSGTRMNKKLPKQFMVVAGKPMLLHSIQRFCDADPAINIVVVIPKCYFKKWATLSKKFPPGIFYFIVEGGATRFESVKNGLAIIRDKGLVAVHDGVRPLATTRLIKKCFEAARKYGSAIPAIPMNDSMRKVSGKKSAVVNRSQYVSIQTPQCFRSEILLKAYQQRYRESFTDDASVVESTGGKIHLVEGERENIKITYAADLLFAEALLTENKKKKQQ